jgi:hypothetical protein
MGKFEFVSVFRKRFFFERMKKKFLLELAPNVPARPPTPGFPPQTSRRAVSLAETRESAARNPDFEGSSTADQIARRSLVAACTLSRHADTYGRQGFQVGTVVLCLCAVGWGRGCAGGRPASSLRTAPDLSFPMIDRCIDLQ